MGDIFTLNGWIPCEKKLPDEFVNVLISHSKGVTIAWWNGRYWTSGCRGVNMYKTVEAWMPLPEKYKRNKNAT